MDTLDSMTIEDLYEEFEHLADWEERCDFLIDLGFELPALDEADKIEPNRVHGCQSNVWLVARVEGAAAEPRVEFIANSDAMIVNGLIAVLMTLYNGKSPRAILDTDAEQVFRNLGLDRHLSPQRRNGLFGMVQRIRKFAADAIVAEEHGA